MAAASSASSANAERGQPRRRGRRPGRAERELALDHRQHVDRDPGVELHAGPRSRPCTSRSRNSRTASTSWPPWAVVRRSAVAVAARVASRQQRQQVVLVLAHPAADRGQLDRAAQAGEVRRRLDDAHDPPLERAEHLPPVHGVGIDRRRPRPPRRRRTGRRTRRSRRPAAARRSATPSRTASRGPPSGRRGGRAPSRAPPAARRGRR